MANNFLKAFIFSLAFFSLAGISLAQLGPHTENISVTATAGTDAPPPVLGGGGGGSYAGDIPKTAVRFSGFAYPFALVTVLEEGKEKISVTADKFGVFSATFDEHFDDKILYSLFARDLNGERSLILNYPIIIYSGYLTHLSGIKFAPTVISDKGEVKAGDYYTLSGYALPEKNLEVYIEGPIDFSSTFKKVYTLSSKDDGQYRITLPTSGLPKGAYTAYIKYKDDDRISKLLRFTIGDNNVSSLELTANIPGDCNFDSIINLVDFSILAFWYKKPNPPVCVDLNKDGIVDLVDFSILAFYWTG